MCKHCETPELIARIDRVTAALDAGGNFNPDAVRALLGDARDHLAVLFRALLAQRLVLSGVDATELHSGVTAPTTKPPPGGLH